MKKAILILAMIVVIFPIKTIAQDDCRFSLVNDPAPGSCSLYVDSNGDNLCDHSQDVSLFVDYQNNLDNFDKTFDKEMKNTYPFFVLASLVIAFYVASYLLQKNKVISLFNHRRIWNTILLLTFLICVFSGLFLVLAINYNWNLSLFKALKPHVNFGIIFALVSMAHILERISFFKNYFRKK